MQPTIQLLDQYERPRWGYSVLSSLHKIHSSQLKMSLILSFVVFDVDGLVIFIEF
jgi:hypothetical protein